MSLSLLTTSGWIWFALTLIAWVNLLFDLALVLGRRQQQVEVNVWVPALMLAWLMWLVTP